MKVPVITVVIERRILVNFTIEPDIAKRMVPLPFTPKIIKGKAIAGICLIRLKHIRLKGLPAFVGIGSENGAHRIAVEWQEEGITKEGVYIPGRDTSSFFNTLVGGRLFPGRHYRAQFDVNESDGNYHVAFQSSDGTTISVDALVTDSLNNDSVFEDVDAASNFFKSGAVGFSPNKTTYEGLLLQTENWEVKPLRITAVKSSFFEDESIFPQGSVVFDNALLMTNVKHNWLAVPGKPILTI